MTRIAALDVGSNSVLMCVGEPLSRNDFRVVYEAARTTRLGEGLDQGGRLRLPAILRTVEVLDECRRKAEILGVSVVRAVATAAVREAENAEEFLKSAETTLGFPVEVISGRREAELTFAGVAGPAHLDPILILDLGGASTELILADEGRVTRIESLPVGAGRLKEAVPSEDLLQFFVKLIQVIPGDLGPATSRGRRAIVVGGTATTFAAIRRGLTRYDPELVEGQEFTRGEFSGMVDRLRALSLEERMEVPGLPGSRAPIITSGGLLLTQILEELGVEEFTVSSRGLRHGILLQLAGAGS
jgi:exopolyphosphatase / guanosine-5'-triphosphate,3'-diphosphate pyrophosphatase